MGQCCKKCKNCCKKKKTEEEQEEEKDEKKAEDKQEVDPLKGSVSHPKDQKEEKIDKRTKAKS